MGLGCQINGNILKGKLIILVYIKSATRFPKVTVPWHAPQIREENDVLGLLSKT